MKENKTLQKSNFERIAQRVALITVGANLLLFLFKLAAGLLASSDAMIGDAIHSASDVFSTFVVMIGIRLSAKKADKEHPYGHERLECVAALLLSVVLFATGLGIGLIQALDCMREMGRVALLGCTRSSKFEIDYYRKVHGRGISLIGAHTIARPKVESSAGLWTDLDDLKTFLGLLKGGRIKVKDLIAEIHSPAEAQAVYDRLAEGRDFPIGVLFDWSKI